MSFELIRTDTGVAVDRGSSQLQVSHIIGIGRNYADHAAEMGGDVPERPMYFTKNPASACLAGDTIRIPAICRDESTGGPEQVDFEAELAVIIGQRCRDVPEDRALEVVLGVTCLLEGPPGTGKTLLARAVAGESGVSFISVSGSQFIEMFVGVGAARVRSLFEIANENKPCVIFIDEIDAIGRQRGTGFNSGNDEREQTLNQILTNMDGFDKSEGIIVLGATNRADILDSALVRAGRFDRKVLVGLPDGDGRKAILNIHLRNKNYDESVDFDEIALLTGGFSGAELENLANEAAILSLRYNLTKINKKCMLDAYEKITIGLPSKSQTKNKDIRELVAYHEAGHTIMAKLFNDFYDVRKVTINANKGGAGGYTLFTPKEQYESYPTKKYMLANLIVALGGRAAEIILFKRKHNLNPTNYQDEKLFKKYDNLDITTGASGDLKQADSIARQYINLFGLNNNLGVIDTTAGNQPFLGRELANGGSKLSEYSKSKIDREVASLIQFALNAAVDIIENNIHEFTDLAKLLLKKNTIDKQDLEKFNILYCEFF